MFKWLCRVGCHRWWRVGSEVSGLFCKRHFECGRCGKKRTVTDFVRR